MAINLKGKKTSLKENAEIYQKRQDEESEREKLKKMNGKQKLSYFTTYYLPKLLVLAAAAGVVCFLLWSDVFHKRTMVLRCAVLNEPVMDSVLTEFSDNFISSIGEDPEKSTASFYVYYTHSDFAAEIGANAAEDLTEISSRIVAADLSCMIADEADGKNYLDGGFFLELSSFLTEQEYKALKPYLYHAQKGEKTEEGDYGIYLNKSPVYQNLTKDIKTPVENPMLSIISNSDEGSKDYVRKLIYYLFPDISF